MTQAQSQAQQAQNVPPRFVRTLIKLQNPFMKWLLRSPLHFIVSRMYVLITVTGRKTGKQYTTPVQYALRGETLYTITSEGYTWWKNLRGGAPVQLRLRGKARSGQAEVITEPQRMEEIMKMVYPPLSDAGRAKLLARSVAITISLQNEQR